jgi:hypothetical protein
MSGRRLLLLSPLAGRRTELSTDGRPQLVVEVREVPFVGRLDDAVERGPPVSFLIA